MDRSRSYCTLIEGCAFVTSLLFLMMSGCIAWRIEGTPSSKIDVFEFEDCPAVVVSVEYIEPELSPTGPTNLEYFGELVQTIVPCPVTLGYVSPQQLAKPALYLHFSFTHVRLKLPELGILAFVFGVVEEAEIGVDVTYASDAGKIDTIKRNGRFHMYSGLPAIALTPFLFPRHSRDRAFRYLLRSALAEYVATTSSSTRVLVPSFILTGDGKRLEG